MFIVVDVSLGFYRGVFDIYTLGINYLTVSSIQINYEPITYYPRLPHTERSNVSPFGIFQKEKQERMFFYPFHSTQ